VNVGSAYVKTFGLGLLAGVALTVIVGSVIAMTPFGQRALSGAYKVVATSQASAALQDLKAPAFPDVVSPALDWRLRAADGTEADMAEFSEDVLFVNLWATWCAPCIAEMPHIEELARRFTDARVAFLIVSDEDPDTVAPFVEEQGWQLPIYTAQAVPAMLQTNVLPATYILDEMREMVFKHIGVARWDDPTTVEFIENLLRSQAE